MNVSNAQNPSPTINNPEQPSLPLGNRQQPSVYRGWGSVANCGSVRDPSPTVPDRPSARMNNRDQPSKSTTNGNISQSQSRIWGRSHNRSWSSGGSPELEPQAGFKAEGVREEGRKESMLWSMDRGLGGAGSRQCSADVSCWPGTSYADRARGSAAGSLQVCSEIAWPWPVLLCIAAAGCNGESCRRGKPPCVTFRLVVAPLRGPGRSPVLPFACCVGSLLSVGRCGRCSCWCRLSPPPVPEAVRELPQMKWGWSGAWGRYQRAPARVRRTGCIPICFVWITVRCLVRDIPKSHNLIM